MQTSTIAIIAGLSALLMPNLSYADDLVATAIVIPITPKTATPHGVYKMTRCVADTGDKFVVAINTKLNSSALSTAGSNSHVQGTWSYVERKGTTISMPRSQTNMFIADANSNLASSYIFTDNQKTGKLTCDPFILVTFDREVSW
jgi:hypothetical protein